MPPAAPHPEVRVEYDQACIGCGYALRGLPVAGVCPECGMAIARSFRGDRLSAADPDYVRQLFRGATLLLAAAVGMLSIWIGGIILFMMLDLGQRVGSAAGKALLFAGLAGVAGLGCAGAFRISTTDPEGLDGAAGAAGRMLVRPGAIALAAGGLTSIGLELIAEGDTIAAALAIAVALLGLLATAIGLTVILRSIAQRSGERRLRVKLRNVAILFAISTALLLGQPVLGVTFGQGLGSLLMLVTIVYGFGVVEEVRAALKRDFAAARLRRASIPAASPAPATAPGARTDEGRPQPPAHPSGTLS